MKVAVIGDMHFGVRLGDQNFLEFQIGWLRNAFLPYCKDNGIDIVIQTGDMFDNRQHIKLNVLSFFLNEFPFLLQDFGIKRWITYGGNHDMYYRDNNAISSIEILNVLGSKSLNFTAVQDTVFGDQIGGKNFAFVPWLNKNNQERLLAELAATHDVDYVFGHFDMVGMPMYKGILATHGLDPNMFKQYKRVISGHYHTVSKHMNIQYVGTPYHLTWMDFPDGTERGFWVLDTANDTFELVRNEEFMTMFSVIEYDPTLKYDEEFFEKYKGNLVKVLVIDKPDEKHYKKFNELLAKAPILEYKVIDTTKVVVTKVEIDPKSFTMSTSDAINDYIDKQDTTIDKDSVKNLSTEIFLEAMSKR